MALDPPSVRPRGQYTSRPSIPGCGSVRNRQLSTGWNIVFAYPIGMWIQG
jgi:hypothetical protein